MRADLSLVGEASNQCRSFAVICIVQGKGRPVTCPCRRRGEAEVQLQHILNLGSRREWVFSITSRSLCPKEKPASRCTVSWMGLGAGLDRHGKSRPYKDSISLYRRRYAGRQCALYRASILSDIHWFPRPVGSFVTLTRNLLSPPHKR